MSNYNVFEKLIGPNLVEKLAEIKFFPAGENDIDIHHMAELSLPIVTPIMDDNIRKTNIADWDKCFTEAADIIQIKAIENFPGIIISENFCSRIVMEVMNIANKAFFNDPQYSPHMESFVLTLDNLDRMNKCVFINIAGLVVKKEFDLMPSLYWFANAYSAFRPPEDMTVLRRGRLLESKVGFN